MERTGKSTVGNERPGPQRDSHGRMCDVVFHMKCALSLSVSHSRFLTVPLSYVRHLQSHRIFSSSIELKLRRSADAFLILIGQKVLLHSFAAALTAVPAGKEIIGYFAFFIIRLYSFSFTCIGACQKESPVSALCFVSNINYSFL